MEETVPSLLCLDSFRGSQLLSAYAFLIRFLTNITWNSHKEVRSFRGGLLLFSLFHLLVKVNDPLVGTPTVLESKVSEGCNVRAIYYHVEHRDYLVRVFRVPSVRLELWIVRKKVSIRVAASPHPSGLLKAKPRSKRL